MLLSFVNMTSEGQFMAILKLGPNFNDPNLDNLNFKNKLILLK